MAKKKTGKANNSIPSKPDLIKNPLSQVFGLLLQDKRARLAYTSQEFAKNINLSSSHYRMIEAGTASLQPNRVPGLLRWVDDWNFDRLSEVLVCIQILDAHKNSVSEMRQVVDFLVEEANPKLKIFLNDFVALWQSIEKKTSKDVSKQIKSLGITTKLNSYLSGTSAKSFDYTNSTQEDSPLSDLGKKLVWRLAPYYFDTIVGVTDGLKGLSPRVSAKELDDWEARHVEDIKNVYGLCFHKKALLDTSACFGYRYLWGKAFDTFTLLGADIGNPGKFKDEFKSVLSQELSGNKISSDLKLLTKIDAIFDCKVRVASCKDYPEVNELLGCGNINMKNLWIYEMKFGYSVCFIDDFESSDKPKDNQKILALSLGWKETFDKSISMRRLCKEIFS